MKGNLNIEIDKKTQNLKAFKEKDEELDVLVKKWKKKLKFVIMAENGSIGFIIHNITKTSKTLMKIGF